MSTRREHVTGFDVYRSAEFRVFCEKFGIAWNLKTKTINIFMDEDRLVITQEYHGTEEIIVPSAVIDTTTLHNEKFRTKEPR